MKMISKITEKVVSLSIAPSEEPETAVPQGASADSARSTPKNTSGIRATKSQRRKNKGNAKHLFNAEQPPAKPDDASVAPTTQAAKDRLLSTASIQSSSTAITVPRYGGLVLNKRKLLSRQEMRAQKAAEAKALLQSINQLAEDEAMNNNDGTPSRACSTPKEELSCHTRKVKFAVEDSPLLSEGKACYISSAVAKTIQVYHSASKKWTTAKKDGAANLHNFVGLKMDKDGNLAKGLDYTAMIYLSDFGDVLKSMDAICSSLEGSLKSIIDLKLSKEVRKTFKPFNSILLRTIMVTLLEICKAYNSEYDAKRAACTKLMNACFHEDDKEDCTRQLNNIVNIWNTDVRVNSKDPRLETFYEEMKAFGWHQPAQQ